VQEKADAEAKYARWKMILKEAAEQSGRGRIPELLPTASLAEAVQAAARANPLCIIPWEEERNTGLKNVLAGKKVTKIAALIGPEGGFSVDEVQSAVDAGFQKVTLGKRILRMETAAVVTAALVFHELE
jgi:16S rRNA (uracil1498-N3)-methyltransferase